MADRRDFGCAGGDWDLRRATDCAGAGGGAESAARLAALDTAQVEFQDVADIATFSLGDGRHRFLHFHDVFCAANIVLSGRIRQGLSSLLQSSQGPTPASGANGPTRVGPTSAETEIARRD